MTKDHDLLIRIDERMTAMSEDYARQGDITTAINEHCIKNHGKKSVPPDPTLKLPINKERIVWGVALGVAAAASAALQIF